MYCEAPWGCERETSKHKNNIRRHIGKYELCSACYVRVHMEAGKNRRLLVEQIGLMKKPAQAIGYKNETHCERCDKTLPPDPAIRRRRVGRMYVVCEACYQYIHAKSVEWKVSMLAVWPQCLKTVRR